MMDSLHHTHCLLLHFVSPLQILIEFCAGGAVDAIMLGKSLIHEGNRNLLQSSGAFFFFFLFAPSSSANSFYSIQNPPLWDSFPSPQLESLLQLRNYCSSDFKEWLVHL